MFEIPLLNPLRVIDTSEINFGFDGNFAASQVLSYQNPKCYFQKWQRSDSLKLQVLSDYVLSDVSFVNVETGAIVATGVFAVVPTLIVGYTFSVYQMDFAMNQLPEGRYVGQFSYTDGDGDFHALETEGICVKDVQENTLLIKYTNSENNYDVIFDTKIEFQFRVEAAIKDFDPKNNRVVYNDQRYNVTQLSATPYRAFKLFIGFKYGVPEWVVDKINRIQSVDQVSYNNVPYQVVDGAEFEVTRNDDNNFMGASIDLQPVDNNFKKYVTKPNNSNEFIPMQKVLNYDGQSSDLGIAGKFKFKSLLEYISVEKRTPDPYTLLVGTTPGGNEIATFVVDEPENVLSIYWLFAGITNVYLTGIAGSDSDISLVYKQLDEPPVAIPTIPAGGNEGKGSTKVYTEVTPGDLAIHWNLATGLGNPNTAYTGWAWADGRNGTVDRSKRVPIMMDESDPNYNLAKLSTNIGSASITLTKGQLPAVGLGITVNHAGNHEWRVSGGTGQPLTGVGGAGVPSDPSQAGHTENMGNGDAIDITPAGVISLWIQKIVD
jgi:hypothetical protein